MVVQINTAWQVSLFCVIDMQVWSLHLTHTFALLKNLPPRYTHTTHRITFITILSVPLDKKKTYQLCASEIFDNNVKPSGRLLHKKRVRSKLRYKKLKVCKYQQKNQSSCVLIFSILEKKHNLCWDQTPKTHISHSEGSSFHIFPTQRNEKLIGVSSSASFSCVFK